jgi:hypothetical protein
MRQVYLLRAMPMAREFSMVGRPEESSNPFFAKREEDLASARRNEWTGGMWF